MTFAIALFVGFLPAYYYATGVQEDDIKPLRTQEVMLLAQPPSASSSASTLEIRVRISAIKMRASFVIVMMWVCVGTATGLAFKRFT